MTVPPPQPIPAPFTADTMPAGEYATVEMMGHSTLVGRVREVERFGARLLQIEPLFRGFLLGPVFVGGPSIYRFTPCEPAVALQRQPMGDFSLPSAVRDNVPAYAQPSGIWPPAFLEDGSDDQADKVAGL